MWTPTLFNAMARLARPAVRWRPSPQRALCVGVAGSRVYDAKCKGFGRKREMLCGVMEQTLARPPRLPGLHVPEQINAKPPLLVGIASALLSLALLRRGWQVTLYCADAKPAGAHPAIVRARSIRCSASMTRPLISFSPPRLPSLVDCMTPSPLSSRMTGAV